jgi:hypothetical protein
VKYLLPATADRSLGLIACLSTTSPSTHPP